MLQTDRDHERVGGRGKPRNLDPDVALRRVLARCAPLPSERVGLLDALDRHVAGDVRALRARPPAAAAAMDGHAVRAAEEWACGDVLLPRGARVAPVAIGLLAAAGIVEVPVPRRPRVALLGIGAEPASADAALERPELPVDGNGPMLEAYCRRAGAVVCGRACLGDNVEAVARWLAGVVGAVDVVISTGGTSRGETDGIANAWRRAGIRTEFWKVAMRPGAPLRFGTCPMASQPFGGGARSALVFALSGNPFVASIQLERFVLPALEALAGGPALEPPRVRMPLATGRRKRRGLTLFLRGAATRGAGAPAFHAAAVRGGAAPRAGTAAGLVAVVPSEAGDLPAGFAEAVAEVDALRGRTWRAVGPLPAIVSIRGASGSGKTCLVEQLLPALSAHGLRVATLKHASHPVALDTPGKDSFRHAAAGASSVLLVGPDSAAAFLYGAPEEDGIWSWLEWTAGRADLVLAEGYSRIPVPAVEIEPVAGNAFELAEETSGGVPRWVIRRPAVIEGPVRLPDSLLEHLVAALVREIERRRPAPRHEARGLAPAGSDAREPLR